MISAEVLPLCDAANVLVSVSGEIVGLFHFDAAEVASHRAAGRTLESVAIARHEKRDRA